MSKKYGWKDKMMSEASLDMCPDPGLTAVLQVLQADDLAGLAQLDLLLVHYPSDSRLHFLKGSVLAGIQRYEEGRAAMAKAIEIAPSFELARFQLGFLEFTSGLLTDALQTWGPFEELDDSAPFRLFSTGLASLAKDEFAMCDQLLRLGIEANSEHPLINGDMQLILIEIANELPISSEAPATVPTTASAAHQLLQQFELKDSANKTKH
jgi:tetratricopeptide (TPR) repeat protein